ANAATNPISAAIGTAGEGAAAFANGGMNGNDKIAAAIVLRGMAKNGKFAVQAADGAQDSVKSAVDKAIEEISKKLKAIADAAKAAAVAAVDGSEDKIGNVANNGGAAGTADAGSVNGIAKGMKGIVGAADGGKELKGGDGGDGAANVDAGHLFAGNAGNGANADHAGKAAAAVNAVSGEQILKAIVDAAGGEQQGAAANTANNPISAAIGAAQAGANFADAGMNGNDKIAAAIVLRGMAKNGKFAVQAAANADSAEGVKSAVEKAIEEISKKLKAIADAVKAAAVVDGGEDKIGNVAANNNGAADAGSVNRIAKGMKGIVDAADGGKELKGGDAGDAGGGANGDAGHLFAAAGGGASAAQAGKAAAAAVNAVSGEQILKAIVDAAGNEQQQGAAANEATNPISAAIGTAEAGADFAAMNRNDKIAAAIVLRGMAKNGKFAVQNAANGAEDSVKSAIEKAIEEISKKLKAIADAAKAAAAVDVGEDKIGNVANNGGTADKDSVKGIAKGMKGIVDASDGGKELKGAGAGGGGGANGDAGHLFAGNGASAAQAGKAAAAVNAVSGEQILKAIVDAAGGEQEGQGAGAANNPISAAIGAAGEGGNFGANGGMNRNDKIAAAIVLRGMAKDGKFAVQNGDAGADGASVKSAIEKAIEEISKKLKAIADAAKAAAAVDVGGEDKIGNVVNNGDAAGTADAGSVKGIAKGMKKIVDAA
uniref:variable large family protein n=1 Tax=Borreliella burgdorferi TaxID=139 RepID=UPI0035B52813